MLSCWNTYAALKTGPLDAVHSVFIFRVFLASIVLLKFRAYRCLCEQAPLPSMHKETAAISPLMSPYQMNVAYYETWRSQLGGFVDEGGKKGRPARDHERDIVQNRPYSSFVDKWIFMLINSDTDMSENCGECGIILTPPPYTPTTVVSSVCGLPLSGSKFCFSPYWGVTLNLEQYATNAWNLHRARSPQYPCGKVLVTAHLALYILYTHNAEVVRSPTYWPQWKQI